MVVAGLKGPEFRRTRASTARTTARERAQQTTHTSCEALRSLPACLFVRRTGCRCDVSTGPRGGSWVRFPAGSARRDHPRPPQRRLLARTVRPRPGATVYGFSVLHALRLLGPPRSAAPRSSTLCCSSPVHGRRTLLLARTRPAAPRSYTPCGSPLVHALRLLARPRSAAPRSSTLCGCVALVVVHGPGVIRRRMRSPRFQWRGASAAFCVLLGVPSLDAR